MVVVLVETALVPVQQCTHILAVALPQAPGKAQSVVAGHTEIGLTEWQRKIDQVYLGPRIEHSRRYERCKRVILMVNIRLLPVL